MTRRVLIAGSVAWLLVGVIGLGLALPGRTWLISQLPPLGIDADALGGALIAVVFAVIGIGVAQVGVLVGLERRWRSARSAGALLASVLAAALLGMAAAALSSAAREAMYALPLICAGALALLGTIAYAVVAVRLAREVGSGSVA
ncbi:MAG: hypothetical protein ACR2GO_02810 [Candidatus Limnocylindria bacterium]